MNRYVIFIFFCILWGIWGMDLVNHLPAVDAWWWVDVKVTLYAVPVMFMALWGCKS